MEDKRNIPVGKVLKVSYLRECLFICVMVESLSDVDRNVLTGIITVCLYQATRLLITCCFM